MECLQSSRQLAGVVQRAGLWMETRMQIMEADLAHTPTVIVVAVGGKWSLLMLPQLKQCG